MTGVVVLAALAVAAATGYVVLRPADNPALTPGSRTPGNATPSPSSEGSAPVIWALGDGADGGETAKQVVDLFDDSDVDRFLYLGDVYEDGTSEEFAQNYATVYGELDSITSPTPGNHEWPQRGQGYDPYWASAEGDSLPYRYAFELAGWEIISLNSEGVHRTGSPQLRWLRRRIEEPGDCRLAFWHAPRFSAGRHGDDSSLHPFWRALSGRARIVLNAHDHNYQRFRPRAGITEFVVGTGGHEIYEVDENDPRLAASREDYGALRLQLHPGRAVYEFVDAEGETQDRGTITCSPAA